MDARHRGLLHRPGTRESLVVLVAAVLLQAPGPAKPPTPVQDLADGSSVMDAQWALTAFDVPAGWEITRGAGSTVAVVDSGVDALHPDLKGRVLEGADYADGASEDGTRDALAAPGHGTQVAGLVSGTGRNYRGHGLLGVAPAAEILPYGVYRDGRPLPDAVAAAVEAAVDASVEVLLLPPLDGPTDRRVAAAVRDAVRSDVVVIAGVGDSRAETRREDVTVPAGVVTVTAVDAEGAVWPHAAQVPRPVLGAPGVDMLTAARDNTYWTGDDTGFAAAWVAGAAALVRAAHPDWTARQTVSVLRDTARSSDCAGACGDGVVDPVAALSADTALATGGGSTAGDATEASAGSPTEGPPAGGRGPLLLATAAALGVALLAGGLLWRRARR